MTHAPALGNGLTCTVEEAAAALGIGRSAAYAAVRRGEIPHLTFGRRVVVKVPALLELVGAQSNSEAVSATDTAAAHDCPSTPDGRTPQDHGHPDTPTPTSSRLRAVDGT